MGGPSRAMARGRFTFQADRNEWYGALAQLGERLHGMQEVSGSIPLGSTIPDMAIFRPCRATNGSLLRFRCSRTEVRCAPVLEALHFRLGLAKI